MTMTASDKLRAKAAELLAQEGKLDEVCSHVANGGSPIELAELWGIRYSDLAAWLYDKAIPARGEQYTNALKARDEWGCEALLGELRKLSRVNITTAFDEMGRLKPLDKLEPAVAAAIIGVEVYEDYRGRGAVRSLVGHTKKVKFVDKLKAIELLGKQLRLFVDQHEHKVEMSLEELVGGSWKKKEGEANDGPA